FPCTRGSVAGRVILERKPVHVIDLQAEAEDFPEGSALARRLGHRTIAGVPLLRGGGAVGTLQLRRTEVNSFTDKQITLLGTFAAQAVIASENARLLNELRQRTSDLSESLEQQTATSEVLSAISSSAGNLEPVFQTMLQNALRICEAKFATLYLCEGGVLRPVADTQRAPPAYIKARKDKPRLPPVPDGPVGRVLTTKQVVHIADLKKLKSYVEHHPTVIEITDLKADRAYGEGDPLRVATVDLGGAQTLLCVPMLKENLLAGAIVIYRQETRPFTDKQVE